MAVPGYCRFPTIHGDTIVFCAEDDLWRVNATGGRAERLTAGVAEATHPRFSPDGAWLAFTGRDEGPAEVYLTPRDGGPARRLTYQGDQATVIGWTPDAASILYTSTAGHRRGMRVIFSISPNASALPTELPYGLASAIAFGPGAALALGRNFREPAFWKRYRGGTAGYIWVDASGAGEFRRLLDLNTNVSGLCWLGPRIFFISDHEGLGNVYSCLPDGSDLRRHTNQRDYYARNLTTDGQRLVYHAGGDLYTLTPDASEGRRLTVEFPTSRAQVARKFVPAGQFLEAFAPHPQGHSVAITTRGKVYSFGAFDGPVLQHGDPDAPRYRLVNWLPDGQRLVAIRDTGVDEPRLAILTADGSAPERILHTLDIGHVVELRASPVGEQVALFNHRNQVLLADLANATLRVADASEHGRNELGAIEGMRVSRGLAWSPDGQWLAYALSINPRQKAIKLCHVASGATHQITDPILQDMQPAFDPQGKYLYFLSQREFDPVQDNLHFAWTFPKGVRPYLLTLRRDLRSPFIATPTAPKSDAAATPDAARSEEQPTTPPPVVIDLDGIRERIIAFPVEEGRYARVQGTHEGVVFSVFPISGTRKQSFDSFTPNANGALEAYHFETHKQERLLDGLTDFEITPNGKTLLYRSADRLRSLKAGDKPPQLEGDAATRPGRESGWLDLDRVKAAIQPIAEWRQMFAEAWRLQREQFWTPDMAGVDWPAAYRRYAPLVERLGSRAELSDLLWELQGELGSSHAYEGGGEYRKHPEYAQGFLGVDWRYDPATERYLVGHIVRGDPWDAESTSPLLAPGVNIAEGDAILAINGQRLTAARGPQQLLVNQAQAELELLTQPAAGGDPRRVVVRALADEHPARYRDWVEANRRAVHSATGGQVGYLHIPDMAYDGYAEFHRYFLQEFDHPALIIDLRWNGGGMVSGLILQALMRPRLGYSFPRYGTPETYFNEAPRGPMVALTDEHAGSDGDIFSHAFKMLNLGPLIGQRTWGGVIGIEPYLPLADGTVTTQPEFSTWFSDVGWGVENYGVDPTIPVEYPPHAYIAGADPQLERAIAEAQRLIVERPAPTPTPGPRPERGFTPR